MLDFPRWKVWAITLTILVGILLAIPSLFPKSQVAQWPGWVPRSQISLGLDLAGGSHLLLEADLADAQRQRLTAMEENVQTELRRAPRIAVGDVSTSSGRVSFMVRDPAQVDDAVERLRAITRPVGSFSAQRDWNVSVVDTTRVVVSQSEAGSAEALKQALMAINNFMHEREEYEDFE